MGGRDGVDAESVDTIVRVLANADDTVALTGAGVADRL